MISVVVATYGDVEEWAGFAARACLSAKSQTVPCEVIHEHGSSLASARNAGAARAEGDWLIFCDADDSLNEFYVASMAAAAKDKNGPAVYQPMTIGVKDGVKDDYPLFIPSANILERNYLPIGTMVSKELFTKVGGFQEWLVLEDWEFWIRILMEGAEVRQAPGAIYEVMVRDGSRNSDQGLHNRVYNEIRARYR